MSLWSRLRTRITERRDMGWGVSGGSGWGIGWGGSTSHDGLRDVGPERAQALATVTACVEMISSAIASLPASLAEDGLPAPPSTPAWSLLRRPNEFQSLPAWLAQQVGDLLVYGNSVSYLKLDGRGAVVALIPAPWPWLLPRIIEGDGGSRLVFDTMYSAPQVRLLGLPPRMLSDEVIHVRLRSDHGVLGRSVLSRSISPVREGLEMETASTSFFRNGMRPSLVLTTPTYLNADQRKRAEDRLREYTGAIHSGKVPLLEGDWKLQNVSLSSIDAQLIEARQFSVEAIARMFHVPSVLLQLGPRVPADLAGYTTAFCQQAIQPLVRLICAEFDHSVLGDSGQHLVLDTDGMARGSFSATVAALVALQQSGSISANETRAELGWGPHPDGDSLQRGVPPSWPADFKGGTHLAQSPGPTGDAPAVPGTHEGEGSGG